MAWQDISTYSKYEVKRTPSTWATDIVNIRVIVTRHIDYPKDVWLLMCGILGQKLVVLSTGTAEDAQHKALEYIQDQLHQWQQAIAARLAEDHPKNIPEKRRRRKVSKA